MYAYIESMTELVQERMSDHEVQQKPESWYDQTA